MRAEEGLGQRSSVGRPSLFARGEQLIPFPVNLHGRSAAVLKIQWLTLKGETRERQIGEDEEEGT